MAGVVSTCFAWVLGCMQHGQRAVLHAAPRQSSNSPSAPCVSTHTHIHTRALCCSYTAPRCNLQHQSCQSLPSQQLGGRSAFIVISSRNDYQLFCLLSERELCLLARDQLDQEYQGYHEHVALLISAACCTEMCTHVHGAEMNNATCSWYPCWRAGCINIW
jgi:hypothetical protein